MSESNNNEFPTDVLIEILKDLPVKSLLRFKCVSKHWRSIIEHPIFIDLHRARSHSRPAIISRVHKLEDTPTGDFSCDLYHIDPEGDGESNVVHLGCTRDVHGRRFWNSVEGLICFGNRIWNPSTRESVSIPSPGIRSARGFTPVHMLGFDHRTRVYKLFGVFHLYKNSLPYKDRSIFGVLDLGSDKINSWRIIDSVPDQVPRRFVILGYRCINNSIYCFINGMVLIFELGCEKLRILPLPDAIIDKDSFLLEDGGSLAFVDCNVKKIWILQDEERWIWSMQSISFPNCHDVKPCGTIHTGEALFQSSSWGGPASYYSKSGKIRKMPVLLKFLEELEAKGSSRHKEDVFFTKHVETLCNLVKKSDDHQEFKDDTA